MNDAMKLFMEGTVIPALPLALTDQGKWNPQRQKALLRYYAASGVGGVAVGVHTTQFAIRDPQVALFEPLLELASDELLQLSKKYNRPLIRIAGACGPTEQAVSEAILAKKYGYDAVLLSPGGLASYSEEEILERTRRVAEHLPVIGFYLQPAVGGRIFSEKYWQGLAAIDGVAGIKLAPFHQYRTQDALRAVASSPRRDQIALYTGNDDHILLDLMTPYVFDEASGLAPLRFRGGLLGHWAVWTHHACRLFNEIKNGEHLRNPEKYLTLAAQVTDANSAFFDVAHDFAGCIAGVHEVLRRQGILEGIRCLDPEEVLSPNQSEEITRVTKAYPHLCDDDFVAQHLSEFLAD